MQQRQQKRVKRLAELIEKAPSNTPTELAKFLIDNGVCDVTECKRKRVLAIAIGKMWH